MNTQLFQREVGTSRLPGSPPPITFLREYCINPGLLKRLALEAELPGHTGAVNALHWNATGSLLLSGGSDCQIRVWDLASRRALHSFESGHTASISCIRFVPHSADELVICGAADCQVRLVDLRRNAARPFCVHRGKVRTLAVADANVVLSGSDDGTVRQIDLRVKHCSTGSPVEAPAAENKFVLVDQRHERGRRLQSKVAVHSLALDPAAGHLFVTGGTDPLVRLYDRRMLPIADASSAKQPQWVGCFVPTFHLKNSVGSSAARPHYISSVHFTYDGREVVASYVDEQIYSFDAAQHLRSPASWTELTAPEQGRDGLKRSGARQARHTHIPSDARPARAVRQPPSTATEPQAQPAGGQLQAATPQQPLAESIRMLAASLGGGVDPRTGLATGPGQWWGFGRRLQQRARLLTRSSPNAAQAAQRQPRQQPSDAAWPLQSGGAADVGATAAAAGPLVQPEQSIAEEGRTSRRRKRRAAEPAAHPVLPRRRRQQPPTELPASSSDPPFTTNAIPTTLHQAAAAASAHPHAPSAPAGHASPSLQRLPQRGIFKLPSCHGARLAHAPGPAASGGRSEGEGAGRRLTRSAAARQRQGQGHLPAVPQHSRLPQQNTGAALRAGHVGSHALGVRALSPPPLCLQLQQQQQQEQQGPASGSSSSSPGDQQQAGSAQQALQRASQWASQPAALQLSADVAALEALEGDQRPDGISRLEAYAWRRQGDSQIGAIADAGSSDDEGSDVEEHGHFLTCFSGHRNQNLAPQEVALMGSRSEVVVSGSDNGQVLLWDRRCGALLSALRAGSSPVGPVQAHPFDPVLATSGMRQVVSLWAPQTEQVPSLDAAQATVHRNDMEVINLIDHPTHDVDWQLGILAPQPLQDAMAATPPARVDRTRCTIM